MKSQSPDDKAHRESSIEGCRILRLPTIPLSMPAPAAMATIAENGDGLPFEIKRVFYVYDLPADSERGGHSHYRHQELLVAAAGSVDVVLNDGATTRTVHLDRPWQALLLTAGVWRVLNNFSAGSILLALASDPYSEDDYVRDYNEFLRLTASKRNKSE
ncbi:MAG: FdtA/QdtA family cupin domain-containing protein [Paramuribaculum sp.]|nr:FdtA/QdtA family cupin domain-containing protein [Paramuribaculum sp.]